MPKVGNYGFMPIFVKDSSANQTTPGNLEFNTANLTANVYKTFYNGAWTNSGAKVAHFAQLTYELN